MNTPPDSGCVTTPDGNCVSEGPCMHTPPLSAEALARLASNVATITSYTGPKFVLNTRGDLWSGMGDAQHAVAQAWADFASSAFVVAALLSEREALAREVEALREANDGLHTILAAKAHGYDMEWRAAVSRTINAARTQPRRTDVHHTPADCPESCAGAVCGNVWCGVGDIT